MQFHRTARTALSYALIAGLAAIATASTARVARAQEEGESTPESESGELKPFVTCAVSGERSLSTVPLALRVVGASNSKTGTAVAAAGDVDADGFGDVLVG